MSQSPLREDVLRDVKTTNGSAYFATATWLAKCGKQPGDEAALSVQIGCHIEELAEFLKAISIESNTGLTSMALQEVVVQLEACAEAVKKGYAVAKIYPQYREDVLDALCDTEVTGNGVAFLAGFKKVEADYRVIASNWSKFDADGNPVIEHGGKIAKSDLYTPPDLSDLV